MKLSSRIVLLILCIASACTKKINLDLNSASPRIVIEGIVSDNSTTHTVKISKTNNFSDNNNYPKVSGALVVLFDNQGAIDTLKETSAGTYTGSKILGKSGVTYNLQVVAEGKTYTSQSTMPNLVRIDTVATTETSFFGSKKIYPQVVFRDPVGERNYYRFTTKFESKNIDGYFLLDDKFSNGNTINRVLTVSLDRDLEPKSGQTYEVKMMCIDKNIYTYFYSLSQSQDGDSGAPDNPVSNISGDALGYFSAQTEVVKTIKIP